MPSRRSGFRLLFLLAVAATVTASAVDPHAAGRDPDHDHVVVGGSALDRARALEWHLRYGHAEDLAAHVPAASHDSEEEAGADAHGARVLSIRSGGAAVFVTESSASTILAAGWTFTLPAMPQHRAVAPSSAPAIESDLLVPEPPPRTS